MATVTPVAPAVNGRPARTAAVTPKRVRMTKAMVSAAEKINNPAPPRLVGHWCGKFPFTVVVDYPPETRPFIDHITPEQHRQAFAELMRSVYVKLPFINPADVRVQILYPRIMECGRLVWLPQQDHRGEYTSLTQQELFDMAVNPTRNYEARPPLRR